MGQNSLIDVRELFVEINCLEQITKPGRNQIMTPVRQLALGYSTQCNLKCGHCVAAGESHKSAKMEFARAKKLIDEMGDAGVKGISFTAGEPFLFADDLAELVYQCSVKGIYSRVVTNSYWASSESRSDKIVSLMKSCGLSQLRLSYSRWHQKFVDRQNVLNAAKSCMKDGLDFFVSFVTDFSEKDDEGEQFLRDNSLKFFPEPVIYSGRAEGFEREKLFTDYQDNKCSMNPYVDPELNMYACCDAGSHFTETDFFFLGNLMENSVHQLFRKKENNTLYKLIQAMGITAIASFAGFSSREIVTYRKCELCKMMFNSPQVLSMLSSSKSDLMNWHR